MLCMICCIAEIGRLIHLIMNDHVLHPGQLLAPVFRFTTLVSYYLITQAGTGTRFGEKTGCMKQYGSFHITKEPRPIVPFVLIPVPAPFPETASVHCLDCVQQPKVPISGGGGLSHSKVLKVFITIALRSVLWASNTLLFGVFKHNQI